MNPVFFILFLLPLIIPVYAQETTDVPVPQDPGIAPDSPFYFIDVALDQIRLNIASSESEKAKIGLEIAEERLAEFAAMTNENKVDAAQKASEEHENAMKDITGRLASQEGEDEESTEAELESTIEVQERLEAHKNRIAEIKEKVKLRLQLNLDRLSENENANLERAMSGLENAITRVDVKIEEEKTRIKAKFSEDFQQPVTQTNEKILKLEKDFSERYDGNPSLIGKSKVNTVANPNSG